MLAKLCVAGGNSLYEEAETLLASVAELTSSGDSHYATTGLHLRALLETRKGNRAAAEQMLKQSPALHDGPTAQKSQCFHYLGLLASDRGDTQAAQDLLFDAYHFATESSHQTGQAEICDSVAGLLLKLGKTNTALDFCRKSLDIKKELSDRYGTAITLGTMGRILVAQAKYSEASVAFHADLEIARTVDDKAGIAIMLNSLANLARLQNDLDEGEQLFRASLAENESVINQIHVLTGLSWIQLDRGDLDGADGFIAVARWHLDQTSGLTELSAILQGLEGATAWRRGEYQSAQEMLQSANSLLRSQQHPLDTIPFLYELRDMHCAQNDMASAVAAMSEALDLLSASGAARGVDDVEAWLRSVDHPRLTRVAIERCVQR